MTAENSSLWAAIIIALIIGVITLAFAIYQANKGSVAGTHDELRDMHAEIALQKGIVDQLQRQGYDNWRRIQDQEMSLARLKLENERLKVQTTEQAALIAALQRQLGGLAHTGAKTGKRLRDILSKRLSKEELQAWAFEVGVPMENLSGETLPALVVSMLDYLDRHELFENALLELKRLRPDLETAIE